jgi:ketosteroid isomerase-like protein
MSDMGADTALMTRKEAVEFALRWTHAWNRRDLDAVLGHFDDDVVFSSPKATEAVGMPRVHGKWALRMYWARALEPVGSLRFTLLRVVWDPESSELAIVYGRWIDGRGDRALEVLQFGPSGLVVRGEAFYGVAPDRTD